MNILINLLHVRLEKVKDCNDIIGKYQGNRWFGLDNHCDDGPIGRLLEVDLYYFDELHDLHNDYHFKTEK